MSNDPDQQRTNISDVVWLKWGTHTGIMENVAEGRDLDVKWRILNVRLKHLRLIQWSLIKH